MRLVQAIRRIRNRIRMRIKLRDPDVMNARFDWHQWIKTMNSGYAHELYGVHLPALRENHRAWVARKLGREAALALPKHHISKC